MSTKILNQANARRFCTHEVDKNSSFDFWNEFVCQNIIGLDCEKMSPRDSFEGELYVTTHDGIFLSEIHSNAARFLRKKKHIQKMNSDNMLFTIRLNSSIDKMINADAQTVSPGDISIYHGAIEQRLHVNNSVDALVYKIPMERVKTYVSNPEDLNGMMIKGSSHLGRLTSNYMITLANEIHTIDDQSKSATITNLLQLLSLCVHDNRKKLTPPLLAVDRALLLSIRQYIAANLGDPELSPNIIAHRFKLSLRYLYNLFESELYSVAEYIKEERLICAKNQILSIKNRKSIAEIAYSVGFINTSHFSKTFRKKFDLTPSDMKVNRELNK